MPYKHGYTHKTEYDIWVNMKQRCHNPGHPRFKDYGARGIVMCDEWRSDFAAFLEYVGPRPGKLTIDRIDNDKGYEPGNVRWSTRSEQMKNRRDFDRGGSVIVIDGEPTTVHRLAKMTGIKPSTIYKRIDNGWPASQLSQPADKRFASKSYRRTTS
jgi:hypothetical protein